MFILNGLLAFDEEAKKAYGDPFIELEPEQQTEFVKKMNEEAVKASKNTSPAPPKPFILMARELTLLGFFTSEAGATQVLQYEAVPGAYHGCLPLSEAGNGRTWAT
jgi:gluconate 2-dehydrogenase gamma chain